MSPSPNPGASQSRSAASLCIRSRLEELDRTRIEHRQALASLGFEDGILACVERELAHAPRCRPELKAARITPSDTSHVHGDALIGEKPLGEFDVLPAD